MKSVCIFCASSTKIDEKYHQDAEQLTSLLIQNGYSIIYGGGSVGLMGTIARKTLYMKGEIIGVIPEFMVKMGWGNPNINEMKVVKDMQERKKTMIQNVDAVIALAGGIGTLDEIIEVITLKQLGQYVKPLIILNTNNYYAAFLNQIDKMVEGNFLREEHKDLWQVVKSPEEIMVAINSTDETDNSVIHSAQI